MPLFSFQPPRTLRNTHLMTLVPPYWPRGPLLDAIPVEARLFPVAPETNILGYCHWQPNRRSSAVVVLVHGLEGCSESHYMRGIARKAYRAGLNVVRLNQRTCGGTEHLTPTLYNSGLSGDYKAIVGELARRDGLDRIWLVGYSMGGNLVLKAAGEFARTEPALAGVIAVCPNIDPTLCVVALEQPRAVRRGAGKHAVVAEARRFAHDASGQHNALSAKPGENNLPAQAGGGLCGHSSVLGHDAFLSSKKDGRQVLS